MLNARPGFVKQGIYSFFRRKFLPDDALFVGADPRVRPKTGRTHGCAPTKTIRNYVFDKASLAGILKLV